MKKTILVVLISIFGILPVYTSANTDIDNSSEDSCAVISVNLRYLSRDANTNGAVSVLQDFLNANGYLKSVPTGFFGSATRSAVSAFQKANNLSARPIGFVGPSTRALIKKIDCDGEVSTISSGFVNQPFNVTFPTSNSVLKIGDTYKVTWNGNKNNSYSSRGEIYRAVLVGDGAKEGYILANINNASDKSFSWTVKEDLMPGKYKIVFNDSTYGLSSQEFTISSRLNNPTNQDSIAVSLKSDTTFGIGQNIGQTFKLMWTDNTFSTPAKLFRVILVGERYKEGLTLGNVLSSDNSFLWTLDKNDKNIIPGQYKIIFDTQNTSTPTTPSTPPPFTGFFNHNLSIGDSGPNVKALIDFLAVRGFISLSTINSTGDYFNEDLKMDLIRFQASVSIYPADGHFGPMTRAYINSIIDNPIVVTPPVIKPPAEIVKCSIEINKVTYTLNPCSIDTTMIDGQGNKNFSTTIIPSDGSSSNYGFSVKGYGVGLPDYGILGASSGGARGNTPINLYFNDSYLSSYNSSSKTYSGYLPIHIFQGSEGSDDNYLHLKINLRVDSPKG